MLTAAALVTAAGHSAADGRQQWPGFLQRGTFHCFLGVHTIVTSAVQRPTNDPVNNNEGGGGVGAGYCVTGPCHYGTFSGHCNHTIESSVSFIIYYIETLC